MSLVQKINSLRQTNNHDARNPERFIMDFHKKQILNGISDRNNLLINDQRRVVFVSLIGLYSTWKNCPSAVLHSSIFMLPLKKKWIYSETQYKNEIEQSIIGQMNIFKDPIQFNEFLCLLKWKNSQNLLFFMLDEYNSSDNNINVIAPFWQHFNNKLTQLYNPIAKSTYKPLQFSSLFWKKCTPKYNISTHTILEELYFLTMKYKCIQEILYQSNPDSLNVIISYVSDHNNPSDPLYNPQKCSITKPLQPGFVKNLISTEKKKMDSHGFVAFENGLISSVNNNNEGIWMISVDYNENDVEN